MEQITELKKKLTKKEITFNEIYEELRNHETHKYRYSIQLLSDKSLHDKGIINDYHRKMLIELILEDGNECIKYLIKCNYKHDYTEKLLDMAMKTGNKSSAQLFKNFDYLLYIVRNIKKEDKLFNSLAVNNIRNYIRAEKDVERKKLLIKTLVENEDLIDEWTRWYEVQRVMTEEERQWVYNKYKDKLFDNRLGIYKFYNNVTILNKFTEYKYVDRLIDKVIKGNQLSFLDSLINNMEKFKLSEEEIDLINAKIILFKITG